MSAWWRVQLQRHAAAKEAAAAAAAAASERGDGAPPDVLPIRHRDRAPALSKLLAKGYAPCQLCRGADGSSGDGDEEEEDDDQIEEERAVPSTIEEERWSASLYSTSYGSTDALVKSAAARIELLWRDLGRVYPWEMCRALSYATTLQLTEPNLSGLSRVIESPSSRLLRC